MNTYKLTFKHYRTEEEITIIGYPVDNYNKQPTSEMLIFFDTLNDRLEAVIKSSIVTMLSFEDE